MGKEDKPEPEQDDEDKDDDEPEVSTNKPTILYISGGLLVSSNVLKAYMGVWDILNSIMGVKACP